MGMWFKLNKLARAGVVVSVCACVWGGVGGGGGGGVWGGGGGGGWGWGWGYLNFLRLLSIEKQENMRIYFNIILN